MDIVWSWVILPFPPFFLWKQDPECTYYRFTPAVYKYPFGITCGYLKLADLLASKPLGGVVGFMLI